MSHDAPLWIVDAFARRPYEGNPAGVMILPAFPDSTSMKAIAREMNLSETAFVVPNGPTNYRIRWFTPKEEAPFCVHATLAAAHILWEDQFEKNTAITFESHAGVLPVTKKGDSNEITLDLPLQFLPLCNTPDPLLKEALGLPFKKVYFGDTRSKACTMETTDSNWIAYHYLVEVESAADVMNCTPNLEVLRKLNCRAVTITAPSHDPYDYVSRYFAPRVGIPEDPFCGSSHCRLAPLWAQKLNKIHLTAHSGSSRGGIAFLECHKDILKLTSSAHTVLKGSICLPERGITGIE